MVPFVKGKTSLNYKSSEKRNGGKGYWEIVGSGDLRTIITFPVNITIVESGLPVLV